MGGGYKHRVRGFTLQTVIKPLPDFPAPSPGCSLRFGHFSANTASRRTDVRQQNAKEFVGMEEMQCHV